jgi:hypothetical protein
MAYGLFDGKYWSRIQADDFASSLGRSQGGSTGPNAWLHVSKELFFHLGELGAFSGVILLVVPLTVLVAARRKFNRHHGFLLAAFLVPLIAWVPITAGNPANLLRYNLSSLAAGGILFACGMECILRRKTIQAAVVVSIFLFNTGYGILRAQELTRTLEVTAGTLSRDAFLKSHLAFYPAVRFINRNLPMTARVLFVGETRGFYCAVPAVIPGSFNGPWFMDLGRNGFQNGFRELGITHILIHVDELNRLKEQGLNWRFEPETATAFLQALYSLKIVYRDSSVVVVEFAKPGPAARGRAVR